MGFSQFSKMQHPRKKLLLPISVLLVVFAFSAGKSDLSSDRAALLALRSAVGGRTTLLWNASDQDTCSWAGVKCEGGRVVVLRLPGESLSGQLPAGIFGNLTNLRTLSLRLNALRGQLPPDLVACTNLRNLYLQGNRFSSEIPEFLFQLHYLVRLNLASNNFSGVISPVFDNLTRLKTLFLENNRLTGPLPELKVKFDQFNVSNNLLNGSVPTSMQIFSSSAFLGNFLCGRPLGACSGNAAEAVAGNISISDNNGRKKLSAGAIAGIVIGAVLGFILIVIIFLVLCRKKSNKKTSSIDIAAVKNREVEMPLEKPVEEIENGGYNNGYSVGAAAPVALVGNGKREANINGDGGKKLMFFGNPGRVFDLEDLLRASAEVLGKGTFGTAYKAVLEIGSVVAVKRLKDVIISEREFREKIEVVGAMEHENLVPLRAYYYSIDEKLLVYDYMPMGSLSALLHGNKGSGRTPLNWEMRTSIALGVARGVEYLHSRGPNISHGNIKSSNVLLTKSREARVSDFGLAHLVGQPSTPNRVAGYRAPEVTDPRKVTQKADVYSFGVLLLELLTGKAPTHALLNEEGIDLPRWVRSVVREEWTSEVFDLQLLRYQNVEEEMVQLLQLAVDCADQYPDRRPAMAAVRRQIEEVCKAGEEAESEVMGE